MIVIFKRNREDDEAIYGKTDHELMVGLAKELQVASDEGMAGHFQVQCVIKEIKNDRDTDNETDK